jgi:pimeloyl-ACP methyl ester carboxylesterase
VIHYDADLPSERNQVEPFAYGGGTLVAERLGESTDRHVVLLHGWGATRESLRGIAVLLQHTHRVHLIDLPGFGEAPLPPSEWSTVQYADLVEQYLHAHVPGSCLLVGHSFGGRVAVRLAARHPARLGGLVLMAVPGLPLRGVSRTSVRRLWVRSLRRLFSAARPVVGGAPLEWHTKRFGSADYRAAGDLRPVFVRVVNEDLTEAARAVACPVLLLWGGDDRETPLWLAYRYHELMGGHARATLVVLPHKDHHLYTGTGAHLCAFAIRQWLAARDGSEGGHAVR